MKKLLIILLIFLLLIAGGALAGIGLIKNMASPVSAEDDDGNTVGTTGSGKELNYTSVDSVSFFNSDFSRKISTLRTINDDSDQIIIILKVNID